MATVRTAAFADLDPLTLYRLLRLRVDVFVVEQACAYPELDGRDLEPSTVHVWIEDASGSPSAYLRILAEADGSVRIGRVVTAAAHRSAGLAATLMGYALAVTDPATVELHAQSYLTTWYEALGFEVDGAEFLDDGILHTPMRLVRSPC